MCDVQRVSCVLYMLDVGMTPQMPYRAFQLMPNNP